MKIVQINSVPNGSTGKIMMNIHKELLNNGHESYVVWGRGRKPINKSEIFLNDKIGVYYHAFMSRLTGKTGFYSKRSTKKLIKILNDIKPDIIHLHNIHGYYLNIELLFKYLKNNNIKVVWTLHDCWSFTGQCPFFTQKKCNKWISGCHNCQMINEYPKTKKDNSKWNYYKKKDVFLGLRDIVLVTPSYWLYNLVKKSYLNNYSVKVINNGIDTNVFKPTDSNFIKDYKLENKKIILGVASVWDSRKGLSDFIQLSKELDDNYRIVLVGLNDKQIKSLPNNIIGIKRTENQKELAGLYSISYVFVNPTLEDNYPTVNLEAIACNTPVITYNTGGSPESAEIYGIVTNNTNSHSIFEALNNIQKVKKIQNFDFSMDKMVNQYIKLYKEV